MKSKRVILTPDPKFGEDLILRFANNLMINGKKNKSLKVFYEALDIVKERTKEEGLDVWKKAIDNCTPQVQVKSRRIGGATFQIPQEINPSRKLSLAMKWLIQFARERKGKPMQEKLADEIIAASREEGGAFKKKEDTHRMAEANKAFSHFRF